MTLRDLDIESRRLIDARLEAIDRVLRRTELSWSERRNIIGEVESQIFELLARRTDRPLRSDVLAVLESLDPPESYVPEGTPAEPSTNVFGTWTRSVGELSALISRATPGIMLGAALVAANGAILLFFIVTKGVFPWLITLSLLGWLNYRFVRLVQTRPRILDELRRRLSAWLMPKDRSQRIAT